MVVKLDCFFEFELILNSLSRLNCMKIHKQVIDTLSFLYTLVSEKQSTWEHRDEDGVTNRVIIESYFIYNLVIYSFI